MTDPITSLPAAVAALGALPMPVGDQPQPLTDRQLAEVDRSWAAYQQHAPTSFACCTAHAAANHVPALRAEVQRLKSYVARIESALCECEPWRDGNYSRPADYVHSAGCLVADLQQAEEVAR